MEKLLFYKLNFFYFIKKSWFDGFSIFYVRGDGLIYKHRVQRVIGQKEEEVVKANKAKKILTNVQVTT